ncbi:proline-, glutamic acid- and leucine-rich protein 1-like [Limanda limanda]|uniref:proline-, glutamic acid- and leucine-rich protein 1-like n=1 Tax=Limanda limanda TaxID=27771 RepID=UPI0029C87E92|nr:proline-, glutamic acid- and leucine-rich protein 1-like [Limanda limanda]
MDRTGSLPHDFNSSTEMGGHHFGPLGRTGRQRSSSLELRAARPSWQLDSDVKLEEREESADDFEFIDAGFSQCPRDRAQHVYLESPVHPAIGGSPVETSFSPPSPPVVLPPPSPPPPPLIQPAASPLPAPPDPNALPSSLRHHLDSPGLEPVLKHLLESFQRLVSDTRGLLVQLESQRQEQARWHQELLTQWLEREERRQRETAEREERREKARMEHEFRVLELLTSLGREPGFRCGGGQTAPEAATGPSVNTDRKRN